MEASFYLKRPDSESETSIFARISFEGKRIKYYIPEKISPKHWNKSTQRARESKKFKEYPEFNQRLDNIEAGIKNAYRKYLNDNDGVMPSENTLKDLLDKGIKKKSLKNGPVTFFGFFQEVIDQTKAGIRLNPKSGKAYTKPTLQSYVTTFRNLSEYNKLQKRKIDFDSFDLDFYAGYMEHMMKVKKFSTNTLGKHIKILKVVLNEATERGHNKSLGYKNKRFITVREDTDNIYLNENEIADIENVDLSGQPKLDQVRDLFLIGCKTGLRYSDYSILKPGHFRDGFIHINQTKTNDAIVIPVHKIVQRIIDKYNGNLPKPIRNQNFNEVLKEVGKKIPALSELISKTTTKGGLSVTTNYKKWECISSHTARRSFATNEYKAGMPIATLMRVTGHRTEQSFFKYLKITQDEHAKIMKLHWDKRAAGLKAV